MANVKRWKVGGLLGWMESEDGPWVRYEDHAAKVQALEAEVAALRRGMKEQA